MGYIYKIINNINEKVYIGQTYQSLKARWRDHCQATENIMHPDHNYPIHLAMYKYGIDNFKMILIEKCDNKLLDEKEIYWISQYNSYYNGYNATLGGGGHTKYNYDEIVDFYLQHNYSLLKTCQHFMIYDQVVYAALQNKGIDYKNLKPKKMGIKPIRKKILLIEKNIIFNSMADIDKYFQKTAHPNIRRCLNGLTEKAYGFHWKELENNELIDGAIIYEP